MHAIRTAIGFVTRAVTRRKTAVRLCRGRRAGQADRRAAFFLT